MLLKIFKRGLFSAFAILGLGALSFGIYDGVARQLFLAKCQRVEGEIVGYKRGARAATGRRSGAASTSYAPVVAYEVAGQSYQITGRVGSRGRHQKGKEVTVAYLPTQPSEAVIDAFLESWFVCLLVSNVGLAFTAFGFFGILRKI